MNICVGCGVSFESNNPDKRFHDDYKCYQKWYHKTYYEHNCDKLKKYGRDYFQKKQALLKSSKSLIVSEENKVGYNNGVRVRIVAPQLSTNGKLGVVIAWKTDSFEGRGIRVLLDGYKTTSIYHPDFIQYI